MLRATLGKAMWVGRGAAAVFGLALVLALLLGVATMALAAVPGDPFRLGQTNGIDRLSTLVGNVATPMLRIDNGSTAAAATALDLRVEAGKPPMRVNSATRVALLNADKVDGKDATAFYAAGSKVADSSHADQADNATNADKLDGLDSSALKSRATPTYTVLQTLNGVANETRGGRVDCDSGNEVLAGGYLALSSGAQVDASLPQGASSSDGGSWFIGLRSGSEAGSVGMVVLCYDYPPAHVATP